MTYGSDGTRTRDLRRDRPALIRCPKDPRRGRAASASDSGGVLSAHRDRRVAPAQAQLDDPLKSGPIHLLLPCLFPRRPGILTTAEPAALQGFSRWAVTGSNRRLPACKGGTSSYAQARIHWVSRGCSGWRAIGAHLRCADASRYVPIWAPETCLCPLKAADAPGAERPSASDMPSAVTWSLPAPEAG